jgi:hypothetical protein
MAKKYFGSENPIGKILKVEDKVDLKVTKKELMFCEAKT